MAKVNNMGTGEASNVDGKTPAKHHPWKLAGGDDDGCFVMVQ